jgi:hypothetical protein
MGVFSDIPVRANGGSQNVDSSWWNSIRTALVNTFGAGVLGETQQSVTDGQSATSITSALFNGSSIVRAVMEVSSLRDDGTNRRTHFQRITCWYNTKIDQWRITTEEVGESCTASACTAVASGLTYTITAGGQVQVAADTMGGSHSGKIRWKVVSTFSLET